MKKNIKYALFIGLFVLLGISLNEVKAHQYTNYFGIQMSVDEYMTLLNLGFTDDEIYYMDEDTFNENKDLVYGAQNESAVIDNTGITVTDNTDAAKQVKVTSGGVFVTNDGGTTWRNAIRGDGISTDLLTAGRINTEQITVYNGDYPSFRWDPNGLNAYKFNDDGIVDTT